MTLVLSAIATVGLGESATAATAECSAFATSIGGVAHELRICPGRAAVGSTVTIEGRGCVNEIGQRPTLVFYTASYVGRGTAFLGARSIPELRPDHEGRFRATYVIPAELGSVQGHGGGPTQLGEYAFVSKPAYCVAPFTVVGLPATGTVPHAWPARAAAPPPAQCAALWPTEAAARADVVAHGTVLAARPAQPARGLRSGGEIEFHVERAYKGVEPGGSITVAVAPDGAASVGY